MKWLMYGGFAVVYLLVAFFGLGPVLMADGSDTERWVTLVIVIGIFVVLTFLMRWVVRRID